MNLAVRRFSLTVVLVQAALLVGLVYPKGAYGFHFPWDQGHDTFRPDNPPEPPDCGCDKCNSTASPYIAATGEYIVHRTDISIPGRIPLQLILTYHSRDRHSGMFGRGWVFSYGVRLIEVTDGLRKSVIVRRPDGNRDRLLQNPDGTYTNPADVFDLLVRNSDTTWTLTQKDGTVFTFNSAGHLIAQVDRNGNRLALAYDATGALASVTDDNNRSLVFTKGANGKIESVSDPINRTFRYAYDVAGNLTSVTDPRGFATTYTYDAGGKLTGEVDPEGNIVASATYDSSDRLLRYMENGVTYTLAHAPDLRRVIETRSAGVTRTILYSENGNVISKSDFLGNVETFTYGPNFKPTRITDKNGNVTSYEYDDRGNVARKTDALGNVTTYTYDFQFNQETRIVENGRTTEFIYDSRGNQIERKITVDGTSRILRSSYDAKGQLLSVDGPRTEISDSTTFTYDAIGNVATITNPVGAITTMVYNSVGQLVRLEEPNGIVTLYTYDAAGNEISRDVRGEIMSTTYNSRNLTESVTFPNGMVAIYQYDPFGRITGVSDSEGNRIRITLDVNGNATRQETLNPAGTVVQTKSAEYDRGNRLTREIGAAGQSTTYAYDRNGNVITVTAPLGRVTRTTYDALNRVSRITDPANGQTLYEYDALGNLTRVTDPLGKATTYVVDGFGDTKTENSPETGVKNREFDAAGNIIAETDARGITKRSDYNALNLLTRTLYSDGSEERRTYVPGKVDEDRLSSVVGPYGTVSWVYDSHDRVERRTQVAAGVTLAVSYAYDTQGRPTQLTYPSGKIVRYEYDAAGKVISLKTEEQTLVDQISYQPHAQVSGWTWGNGTPYRRTYNLDGELVTFPMGPTTQTLVYDTAKRITGINGSIARTQGYDNLDRVIRYTAPGRSQTYTYDANSNRRTLTDSGQTTTYVYDPASSRLVSRTRGVTFNYTYDAIGNILNDGARTFFYDVRGRMSQMTSGSSTTTYRYNGLGQRVAKTVSGSATVSEVYAYDEEGRLLGVYDSNGRPLVETVYLHDTPVAVLSGTNTINYIFSDHINTPRVITTTQNTVVWRWESDPFGVGLPDMDPDNNGTQVVYNSRFPGQYFDSESALHYNYFRDYDPTLGRYVQADPIGLRGGLNLYLYANGNPVSFIDPTGEAAPAILAAIAAAFRALQAAIARCAGNPVCRCRAFYAAYKVMCGIPCNTCNTPSIACCATTSAEAAAAGACVTLRGAYIASRCDFHIPTTKDHPGAFAQAQRALANCSAKATLMCKCLFD